MNDLVLTPRTKSIPPQFWGRGAAEVAAERPALRDFSTPLLTIDASAEAHNVERMFRWARENDIELAPHGKTSMSPELWHHLVDAGASSLTLATPWQVQVARDAGFTRIGLANELSDPRAISWVVDQLESDADFEFSCFLDSPTGLELLAATEGDRPIDVLVELGADGGRAGARGVDGALAMAWAASREPRVRLIGVAGWEGPFGGERTAPDSAAVRHFLDELVRLHDTVAEFGLFDVETPIVSAGGSMWFDVVAEAFAPLAGRARRVVRSGAFQLHDDIHYGHGSPFTDAAEPADRFVPALAVWSRVLSRPEHGLALLDAGRRDLPFDLDLPVPQNDDGTPLAGAAITSVNDQHAFLSLPDDSTIGVGDVVRLGLSHPCTALDKWRVVPVVDDSRSNDPRVTGFIETVF